MDNRTPDAPAVDRGLSELTAALNAMLTQFGMDEDEWSKPVFDRARRALAASAPSQAEPAKWKPAPGTPEARAMEREHSRIDSIVATLGKIKDEAVAAPSQAGSCQASGEAKPVAPFNLSAFVAMFNMVADTRRTSMKEVARVTGVNETTLSRMRAGERAPDAASLAALSAWAGLNPANYCGTTPAPPAGRTLTECHGLDTPERVCFYEQDFYVLSNFSSFGIEWQGRWFPTSEHAYHWEKFYDGDSRDEANTPIAYQVMNAPSAHEAFKIAERNKRLRRADWDAVKVDIMRGIIRAKADQHEYVRRKLLATGDRELVENSWRDDFWGWGPNRDGRNMLGRLWMEVRAELRAASSTTAGLDHG